MYELRQVDARYWSDRVTASLRSRFPGPQLSCTFGYGEQMNQITHFHDGSNLYGSDQEDARDLRELRGGLMRSSRGEDGGKELLPQTEGSQEEEECQIDDRDQRRKCFTAGQSRPPHTQTETETVPVLQETVGVTNSRV